MYAIAGASGRIGSAVIETLIEFGEPVRAVVRGEHDRKFHNQRGHQVAVATFGDGAALADALKGATAAFLFCPVEPSERDWLQSRESLIQTQVEAVRRAGVERVVYVSAMGAHLPEDQAGIVHAAQLAEQAFADVPEFIALRPCFLIESLLPRLEMLTAHRSLPTSLPTDLRLPFCNAYDVGMIAAGLLRDGSPDRIVEIAGPNPVSIDMIADEFSELLGIKIKPVEFGARQLLDGSMSAPVSEEFIDRLRVTLNSLRLGGFGFENPPRAGGFPLDVVIRMIVDRASSGLLRRAA